MALEMGKPLAQGEAEVEKCARGCEHYAEKGPAYLADEPREVEAGPARLRCHLYDDEALARARSADRGPGRG